jgi:hypothetical protein
VTSADELVAALLQRYSARFTRSELLKAIRALSARYVESRGGLSAALDSDGKRAAFAAFYAPLHYLTTREILRALDAARRPLTRIIDLGCGTGLASAAWSRLSAPPASIAGIDRHPWAAAEAAWTWSMLGLDGRATRGDLLAFARRQLASAGPRDATRRATTLSNTGVLCAWTVNELPTEARDAVLTMLLGAAARGAAILVVEPIARSATPWWSSWTHAFIAAGGRADEWKFPAVLPAALAALDRDAGFQRRELAAKSVSVNVA